jgi:hypothetical protein
MAVPGPMSQGTYSQRLIVRLFFVSSHAHSANLDRLILDVIICAAQHQHLSNIVMHSIAQSTVDFHGGGIIHGPTMSVEGIFILVLLLLCVYSTVQFLRPFVSLYGNLRRAQAIGLPMKVIPFPPGLFSFFAFQILRRLGLLSPGTKLHRLLSMGRPDGYDLHKEMGDVFVTVSPAGLTLIVADPKVVTHVNSKRAEFPKPPNTGGE